MYGFLGGKKSSWNTPKPPSHRFSKYSVGNGFRIVPIIQVRGDDHGLIDIPLYHKTKYTPEN